jgi:LysM repeat protein
MELLGPQGRAESGTREDELVLDGEGQAPASREVPASEGDPLAEMGPAAPRELEAGGKAPENGSVPPQTDEPLDPALVDLFREARNEAQESALASELPDIPIQDLLSELVSVGQRLGIGPPVSTETAGGEDSAETEHSPDSETGRLSLIGLIASRRQVLHILLLSLTLAVAVASALMGASRLVGKEQGSDPTPTVSATAHAGVVLRQLPPGQTAPDATPEATPAPTPTRQPAYFMYTVQRGDTLIDIARAFGLSPDHILWTNPDVIDDPNLLLVGDRLLIPNVAGMVYFIKPGDILSAIGRVLPQSGQEEPDPPPQQPQPH